ncbi:phage tail tape measure protein [Rosenbergiella metrosideri]|uniref:phage tail tape measure protein n=3 Tax=Rosenbergiella TaxID=1356488 RepID=UPI001F4FFED9|nr:phage tail tape measure protein [Rosenbergiella metrosideri]
MAEQTSRLAVIIDSSGAQKNTETLASSLVKLTQAGQKAADGAGKVTKSTEGEAKAISDLKKAIDPVGSAIDTLGKRFTQLKSFYGKGLIDQEEFTFLSQKINQTTEELSGVAQAQRDAEKAGEAAEAQQQAQAQAFQRMLDKIDPLSSALRNLDQQQSELSKALSSGKINTTQYDAYTQKLNETRREINGEAQAERDAIKAHDAQAASLQRLVAQLDPVGDAFRRLSQQQKQLDDAKSSGLLSPEAYTSLSSSVSTARGELEKTQQQLLKTGQSAKQTAFAMRMIPAQMTDIVVGLSTGQSPFMVLMQQGGQLKDMFGGIGPAIRGVGGYVLGLASPFTIAAGAVAAYGLAFHQAQEEMDALNKSANTLNNVSGLNLTQITALAHSASALGVSYGDAISAVGSLTQSLSTNADMYPQIIKASSDYANASGQDLNSVVGMFSQLSDSSGKSIDQLDDKLGFLTAAQRKQIDAALEGGNTADAQRQAFGALSDKLGELTTKLNQGATGWNNFWHSLGAGASNSWEVFKEIAGGDYLENADIRKYQQRTQQRSNAMSSGTWTSDNEQHYQMLNDTPIIKAYVSQLSNLGDAQKKLQEQSYLKQLNTDLSNNADATTKAREALAKLDSQFKQQPKNIQEEGRSDYLALRAKYSQNLADAQSAAAKKDRAPATKAYSEDAGTKLIDQLNQQHAALAAQVDTTDKLSTAQQALVKWEQQLADIKGKSTLTADQKSLLANQDKITALYQQNAALERQQQLVKQTAALSGYQSSLNRDISSRNSQYSNDESAASGARSAYQQGILTQRITLEQQLNDKIIQLRQQRTSATTDIDRQTIDQEIAMQQSANDKMLADYDSHTQRMTAMRGSWSNGAEKAWQEYADSASNASGMTQTLFSDTFSSMEDAIVSFSTSGKLSFKGFANSVISDIARIAARLAISGLASSVIGGVSSYFSGGATATTSSNSGSALSNAASNIKFNAKGGVYDSPSLSSYSNQVYTSPKLFAFAKGAGVFGEAGPEAIMPLTRGKNGSLGVRAIGAQSSTGGDINLGGIVVNVDSSGKASNGSSTDGQGIGKQIQSAVINTINEQATKQGTPLWRAIKGR